jgi:Tol biopolymer transport system component
MSDGPRYNNRGLTISGSVLLFIVVAAFAMVMLSADSNRFNEWNTPTEVIDWILLLRPFSTTEVDAVRKTLIAIESGSEAEYRECFSAEASISTQSVQLRPGFFSQTETLLLESDGRTATVHLAAVWNPSIGIDTDEKAYLDQDVQVVKGLVHIRITEPIQFQVPIPGWFVADGTGSPFRPLTEVPLTSPLRLPGRLAVSGRETGPRSILERLGIGSCDRESDHIQILTLADMEAGRVHYETCAGYRLPGSSPSWSPDGTKLAFLAKADSDGDGRVDEDDTEQLFLMNPDGSDRRRLTSLSGATSGLEWSYDGTKLAFIGGDEGNQVFVINADGSGLQRIDAQSVNYKQAAWSPVSTELAFNGADGNVYIFDSTNKRRAKLSLPPGPYGSLSWAPRGDRLVVTRWSVQGPESLIIHDLRKGSYEILETSLPGNPAVGWPVWSPDGQTILFATYQSSYYSLWVMNSDGSDLRRLTSTPLMSRPVWFPGGRYIALIKQYDSNGDGQSTDDDDRDVFIYDIASGSWAQLGCPTTWESGLSWTASITD